MVTIPSLPPKRTVARGVWTVGTLLVAVLAGAFCYGAFVVGPFVGAGDPTPYAALVGASLVGTLVFVAADVLDA